MADTSIFNREQTGVFSDESEVSSLSGQLLLSQVEFKAENGDIYDIFPTKIGEGGESQVYRAVAKTTGYECVAKIYTSVQMKEAARYNRAKVIGFLKAHRENKVHHILPLLAVGFISITDANEMTFPYPIDIYPFCPGGDFGTSGVTFTYSELKSKVIPALCTALQVIHNNHFIHRDLKPGNIYELNGEIVVSDFGTAVYVDDNTEDISYFTELARNTPGYSAPEVATKYAKKASDYFSLGCTLATLYNGKHPYETILMGENKIAAFFELINEKGIEMNYRKGDEPLKHLIDALVRPRPSDRIGYDDIMLWINDDKMFYEQHIVSFNNKNARLDDRWKDPFNFNKTNYWNSRDLSIAMALDWENAKGFLYRGNVIKNHNWNHTLHYRIECIINDYPTAENYDLGLAYFLHYLYEGGKYCWCGCIYDDLAEIASVIFENENIKDSDDNSLQTDIIKMFQSEYLSWKLNETMQIENLPEEIKIVIGKNLQSVLTIEQIAKENPDLAYYYAMYQWSNEPKAILNDISPDKMFSFMTESNHKFYEEILKLINDDNSLATIAALGYIQQVLLIKNRLGTNNRENIESIYDLFESICNEKKKVRNHYYNAGPDSYLYWLRNNLSLYSFNTKDAEKLSESIENIGFSDDMPLNDLRESFRLLSGCFSLNGDFQKLFQGDFILSCLGLKKGKDRQGEITANHIDAFFIDTFFGMSVPSGFKKWLDIPFNIGKSNVADLLSKNKFELSSGIDNKRIAVPKTGSYILFGELVWRVLDIQENKALIITEFVLNERSAYSATKGFVTWEHSIIRKYLNGEFLNSFNETMKSIITQTRVVTQDNHCFGSSGGNVTDDKIFLLSIEEAVMLFGNSGYLNQPISKKKRSIDDEFNKKRIAFKQIQDNNVGFSWWWLRSPGFSNDYASVITGDGIIRFDGRYVNRDRKQKFQSGGVRPAMWIDLKEYNNYRDNQLRKGVNFNIPKQQKEIISLSLTLKNRKIKDDN